MPHAGNSINRRVLSLWLPRFATERLCRPRRLGAAWRERAFVTTRTEQGRLVVVAPSAAAAAAGIAPAMPLADARALLPDLKCFDSDPAGEARDLGDFAEWCGRYTPLVATDGGDGVLLDIAGCQHLFGGERAMLDDLEQRLARIGFSARAAIADTPGAAWAAARFADPDPEGWGRIVPPGEARQAIAPLSVAGLRLPPETVDGLRQVGLHRIGDLYAVPRAPLAARFGAAVGRRLDQALGESFEPVDPRLPVPPWRMRLGFAEPIAHPDGVRGAAQRLVEALCERLGNERRGARRIEIAYYGVDGTVARAGAGAGRPVRDPGHRMRRRQEPRERVDRGFGAAGVVITAPKTEPLGAAQLPLPHTVAAGAAEEEKDPAALALLVDRLAHRLGERRVVRQVRRESHIPERAAALVPPLEPEKRRAASAPPTPWPLPQPRPLRLLDRPEPIQATAVLPDQPPVMFRWRSLLHRVRRAEGPERIAPEWWHDLVAPDAETRDYYCLESAEGRRFWVFREGLYRPMPPAEKPPGWYVHGLFA